MTEIRQIEFPEKDLPLRSDVSLMGQLLGQAPQGDPWSTSPCCSRKQCAWEQRSPKPWIPGISNAFWRPWTRKRFDAS